MQGKASPYKVPNVMVFMDQLPLSKIGRVLKRELKKIMDGKEY